MNILVGCECSGAVRRAFEARGHKVVSCDIKPAEDGARNHYQGRIQDLLPKYAHRFDTLIVFPDCTYVCVSGLHWNKRDPARALLTEAALEFDRWLLEQDIPRIVLENPVGCLSTRVRKASQYIQPYYFGDDASKKTGLWLKGVEPLVIPPQALWYPPRIVVYQGKEVKRWGNQTDSGQNRPGPSDERATERSRTYAGIAAAFAENWG